MTHKIIHIPNQYLLIVDEKAEITDWMYHPEPYVKDCRKLPSPPKAYMHNGWFKILAHLPLNNSPILEGVDLLPEIEHHEDFWENMPVRWVKWTKRQPSWNGSVWVQFNGKNQGRGLVNKGELYKLEGLDNSEFENYRDTFYWLEQDFNYMGAASQTKKYSEEDIINMTKDNNVIEAIYNRVSDRVGDDDVVLAVKVYLKSLSTPKIPIGFKPEIERTPTVTLSSRGCVLSNRECSCDASESSWCEYRHNIPYREETKKIGNVWQGEYVFENQ